MNGTSRLTTTDRRFLLGCLLVFVITVWFSAEFFYRAFPEASIDFVVTREQSQGLARQFLAAQNYNTDGYRHASAFQFDNAAKTFLERELGLEKANQLMARRVRLWHWSHRWFQPLQKEEYRAEITPRGETAGFHHLVEENAPGASLPPDRARALAENFLRHAIQRDLATLDFVESSSVKRPARIDHIFTWKERDFSVHDATYRMEVTVLGDRLGGYREYLKVPETWLRDYERLRSRNQTAQSVDTVLFALLAVGALVVLLSRVRSHDVRWRRAAGLGTVAAVLFFLSSWNGQPMEEFQYPTTDSWLSFLVSRFLQTLLGALAAGGAIFLLTAAAEPLYRESFPLKISLGNLFRWRALRTKSFLLGSTLGVTLTGVFVAYQTAFYLLASRWGAWSPADVPYDDLLNTRFPWLFVMFGGFLPAVSEEFLFRMFSIPFLGRLFRSIIAAVMLAGFIWGFGHAGYPQQPFYIRGVEVGIGGVVLGFVMLRWGILPTLVWHYSVDALYTALLLLRSHNLYFVFSGAASAGVMLLPLAVAWIAYLKNKEFESEAELTNQREGSARAAIGEESLQPVEAGFPYRPWSARRRRIAVALAIVALLAAKWMSAPALPSEFAIDVSQARPIADNFLRERGFNPQVFRHIAYPESPYNPGVPKYFLERRALSYFIERCLSWLPLNSWTVRYYRPLEKEEIRVSLDPRNGKVIGFDHLLPEDGPGADLAPEAAQKIAADFLASRGFDLSVLELKETSTDKKKARRDHNLTWEAQPADPRNLDEARYRVYITVAGNLVVRLSTGWKLPEAFIRQRAQRTALANTLFAVRLAFITAAVLTGTWILIQRTRAGRMRWRATFRLALPLGVLLVLGAALGYRLMFQAYDTAMSLEAFQSMLISGLAIGAIGGCVSLLFAAGLLVALHPNAAAAFSRMNRRRLIPDALTATLTAATVAGALVQFRRLLVDRFHAQAFISIEPPAIFASASPWLSALSSAASETMFGLALLALVTHVVDSVGGRLWLAIPGGLLAAAAFVPSQVHSGGEFLLQYGFLVLAIGLASALAVSMFRNNYLAYALLIWSWALGRKAVEFLSQPAPSLERQGWLLLAILITTLVWAAFSALVGQQKGRSANGALNDSEHLT